MRWQPWALAAVFAAVFARLSARVRHLFLFGRTRTELVYRVQRLERGIAARRHALSRAAARITALREQRAAARERRDVLK